MNFNNLLWVGIATAVSYIVYKRINSAKNPESKTGALGRPCYCTNPVTGEQTMVGWMSQKKCAQMCSSPTIITVT